MSYSKQFYFYLFTVFLTAVSRNVVASSGNSNSTTTTGKCACGGYPTSSPKPEDEPLLSQSPGLIVKCDMEGQEGHNTCKGLCGALAIATKAKGPEILCAKLVTASELKLSMFYKVCDQPWTYGNVTAEEPLCCEDSKHLICPTMEATAGASAGAGTTTTDAPHL